MQCFTVLLPPDTVDKDIMFSCCLSTAFIRSYVRLNTVIMISH